MKLDGERSAVRPLSGIVLVYLLVGILYQYLVYGDASISQISTWFHVLFWFWLIAFHVFFYVSAIFIIAVIVFSVIKYYE